MEFPVETGAEVVLGLVGPVGTNLDLVGVHLEDRLKAFRYALTTIRMSAFLPHLEHDVNLPD